MAKPVKYPAKLRKTLDALPEKRERQAMEARREQAYKERREQENIERKARQEQKAREVQSSPNDTQTEKPSPRLVTVDGGYRSLPALLMAAALRSTMR